MSSPEYGSKPGEIKNPSQNPFKPNWEVFNKKLTASLLELCCYAHEIDLLVLGTWKPVPKDFFNPDNELVQKSLEEVGLDAVSIRKTLEQHSDEYQQWCDISFQVYAYKCVDTLEVAQSHTSDRGGSLKVIQEVEYCEQVSQLIRVDDFVTWAGKIGLGLPEGFIRSDDGNGNGKSKSSAEKFATWQKMVDEMYSKNKKLTHTNICVRLSKELKESSEYIRRWTDNPKNK